MISIEKKGNFYKNLKIAGFLDTGKGERMMESVLADENAAHLDLEQLHGLIDVAGIDGTREILEAFWESTQSLIDLMAVHVDTSDLDSAATTAHAIKGSAANVGAQSLLQQARQFEELCRTGTELTGHHMQELTSVFSQTRQAFHDELVRSETS